MPSRLSMLTLAGAASAAAVAAVEAQPSVPDLPGVSHPRMGQNQTQTCEFRGGARAGQTVSYAGSPGAPVVQVGSRCADMQGSSGVAVAQGAERQQSPGRFYSSPGAPRAFDSSGNLRQGFTQTCRFNNGPLGGTTADFSHTLGAEAVAIGGACADGSSQGVGVAQAR
jgi:hypothetical protein